MRPALEDITTRARLIFGDALDRIAVRAHISEQAADDIELSQALPRVGLDEAERAEPRLFHFGDDIVLDEIDLTNLRLFAPHHPICQAAIGSREGAPGEEKTYFALWEENFLPRHRSELRSVRDFAAALRERMAETTGERNVER